MGLGAGTALSVTQPLCFPVLGQVLPEDAVSEEESFRCQPGREEGLGDAEIHQTAGIGAWTGSIQGAVTGRGLRLSYLLMLGTHGAIRHSVDVMVPLIDEQECHQVCKTANCHCNRVWGVWL